MAHEIETKVLDIDSAQVEKRLAELGGMRVRKTRLIVDWYRPTDTKEGEDVWYLRIRSNSEGVHEVTWKAKSEILGVARKHKEINFNVTEPEKLGLMEFCEAVFVILSLNYKLISILNGMSPKKGVFVPGVRVVTHEKEWSVSRGSEI